MTEDECRKVCTHLIDAWPNGPKAYIWREALEQLKYPLAVQAFKAMRDEYPKTPTVAVFRQFYGRFAPTATGHPGISWQGNEIGLDEYLKRLAERSATGSQDATDELDNWNRWLSGNRGAA